VVLRSQKLQASHGFQYGLHERKIVQLPLRASRPTLEPTQPPSQFMQRRPSFIASGMKMTNLQPVPQLNKDWSLPPHEDTRFTMGCITRDLYMAASNEENGTDLHQIRRRVLLVLNLFRHFFTPHRTGFVVDVTKGPCCP
jgi:hypothetical protein